MFCAIWNHLFKLKNAKNTHGGAILLVKASACNFTESITPSRFCFLNCTNGNKLRKGSQIYRTTTQQKIENWPHKLFFEVSFFIVLGSYHKDFDNVSKRYLPCSLCILFYSSSYCPNFSLYLNCFVLWI